MKARIVALLSVLAFLLSVGAYLPFEYRGEPLDSLVVTYELIGSNDLDTMFVGENVVWVDTFAEVTGRGLWAVTGYYLLDDSLDTFASGSEYFDITYGQGTPGGLMRIYAYDTANSAAVAGATICLYTKSNQWKYNDITSSAGYADFYLPEGDTFKAYCYGPGGYGFPSYSEVVGPAVSGMDSVYGYGISAPAPSPGVDYVTAYIDVGTGHVDTLGSMVTHESGKFVATLSLIGEENLRLDSTWAIVPRDYRAEPDTDGRITFRVPANTQLSPAGSKYQLKFMARGGTSLMNVEFMKFILDTVPDPINILNATRVP